MFGHNWTVEDVWVIFSEIGEKIVLGLFWDSRIPNWVSCSKLTIAKLHYKRVQELMLIESDAFRERCEMMNGNSRAFAAW
jgi:hypothetical protein